MIPEPPAALLAADFPAARARVRAAAQAVGLAFPLVHPELKVFKGDRRLELWAAGKRVKAYQVGLGLNPGGDKVEEGDFRTPEGRFYVCTRNAQSKFHRFLGLSYPNGEAAARGLRDGLITKAQHKAILDALRQGVRPPWDTKLGGQVGVHGHGASSDWTWGCVALEDADIEELWEACPKGTPVDIAP
jgi:murein L,D-transpeptidase YafK